ncbi:MAG: phosphoribosylanthranilate isomerase [Methanospirillum sp.]|nr:phosphoribosylanthranilate isomerase [Methanospirillum sp.]
MRVKICGITRPEDARIAEKAGADAIGVVMFSDSPREVDVATAASIFRAAGPFMGRVCVSHTGSPDDLSRMLDLNPTAVQISSPLAVPKERTFQVIRVIEPGDGIPEDADALIIDASRGSGRLYDQSYVSDVMNSTSLPVILAGGLTPENVRKAIRSIRPYAVDVASGVESAPGIKEQTKVFEFVKRAKETEYET